jgi:hypothetical protein
MRVRERVSVKSARGFFVPTYYSAADATNDTIRDTTDDAIDDTTYVLAEGTRYGD